MPFFSRLKMIIIQFLEIAIYAMLLQKASLYLSTANHAIR